MPTQVNTFIRVLRILKGKVKFNLKIVQNGMFYSK